MLGAGTGVTRSPLFFLCRVPSRQAAAPEAPAAASVLELSDVNHAVAGGGRESQGSCRQVAAELLHSQGNDRDTQSPLPSAAATIGAPHGASPGLLGSPALQGLMQVGRTCRIEAEPHVIVA